MSPLRIKAQITIELEARDLIEAGEHQRRLEAHYQDVRSSYPEARLDLKDYRARGSGRAMISRPTLVHYTGRVQTYVD